LSALTFADLGVPQDLLAVLTRAGIDTPFPVQAATLPDALAGRDLSGGAPTGSGKTLAFAIPLVVRITAAKPKRPTGLVLVPTRELAAQVQQTILPFARVRGLGVVAIYGGSPMRPQAEALRRGASIVVACPGRLTDLVEQRLVDLSAVQVVVVDEADRMADMGFLPQVRRLLDLVPKSRQTLLWSATLDGDVGTLVQRYQNNPVVHKVVATTDEIDRTPHHFWSVETGSKAATTANVLRSHGQGIVFCRTRHGADRVARQLGVAGVATAVIHGSRTQAQRDRAIEAFRRGEVSALVATDVAARGIHVDDVAVVVHWDPVADPKDYVHRSGRTARAGAHGVVVSLIVKDDRAKAAALQRALNFPVALTRPDSSVAPSAPRSAAPVNRAPARSRPRTRRAS
jgi:superfamily II DNA/RNA helicase